MPKIDLDLILVLFIALIFFGMAGAVYYTEYSKSKCIEKSLESKLTVTEVQVLCGK